MAKGRKKTPRLRKRARGRRKAGQIWSFLLGFLVAGTAVALLLFAGVWYYYDREAVKRFEQHRWQVPARVYSKPLQIAAGGPVRPGKLELYLQRRGYQEHQGTPVAAGQYERHGNVFHIYVRGFTAPDVVQESALYEVHFSRSEVRKVLAKGRPVVKTYLEPEVVGAFYPQIDEDRILVRLKDVPDDLEHAILATEDRRFFQHYGLDPRGIARAIFRNLQAGRAVEGGSTLTQQLVKNLFLTSERKLSRKFREALMAISLERRYSKQEIFEAYLNEVYLGQHGKRGVHGVGLASRFYFGTEVGKLDLPQVALLAGMIQGPNLYNPFRNPDRAKRRRDEVLGDMVAAGYLSAERAAAAKQAPLELVATRQTLGATPAFLDLVRRQLRESFDEKTLTADGLRIYSTLDIPTQEALEEAVAKGVAALEGGRVRPKESLQGAGVVVEPSTGEVLAVVGGRDPKFAGFNRALDAVRPVGSLMKPAVYLTALKQWQRYNLGTVLSDRPFRWELGDQAWQPRNFDGRSHGDVPLHSALARSLNVPTVRLGHDLGLSSVLQTVHALGPTRTIPEMPSTLLGAAGLSPLEMAQAYQTLANGGAQSPLRSIDGVYATNGLALARYRSKSKQVVDERAVYLLNYALQEVVSHGTARRLANYVSSKDFAGKTGTSNDGRDAWFAGFSARHLAVVWVGRDDNAPTGLTGGSGALPVFGHLAKQLGWQAQPFEEPVGVVWADVDVATGNARNAVCRDEPSWRTLFGLFGGGEEAAAGSGKYVKLPFFRGGIPGRDLDCARTEKKEGEAIPSASASSSSASSRKGGAYPDLRVFHEPSSAEPKPSEQRNEKRQDGLEILINDEDEEDDW